VTRIAAFDLDGTLTNRDCVVPFLRQVAGTPRLVAGVAAHPIKVSKALVGRDRDTFKALATRAAFAGRPLGVLEPRADEFAALVHGGWLRSDTLATLQAHLAAEDQVVIVSASYAIYVEPLAALLGAHEVLATRLAVGADGRLTGDLDGANCRGPEKVRRLHEWLDTAHGGRSAVEVVAYGDSPGDREMLADADEPHWIGKP
jgi:phosphatidylglycerophosphatase C